MAEAALFVLVQIPFWVDVDPVDNDADMQMISALSSVTAKGKPPAFSDCWKNTLMASVRVRPFLAYTDSSSCLISGLIRTRNTSVLAAETMFSIKQTPFVPWFSSYPYYTFTAFDCQSM